MNPLLKKLTDYSQDAELRALVDIHIIPCAFRYGRFTLIPHLENDSLDISVVSGATGKLLSFGQMKLADVEAGRHDELLDEMVDHVERLIAKALERKLDENRNDPSFDQLLGWPRIRRRDSAAQCETREARG